MQANFRAVRKLVTRTGWAEIRGASATFRKVWSILGYDTFSGVEVR